MDLNDLLSSLSDEDMQQLQQTASQLLGNMSQPAESSSASAQDGLLQDAFALDPKMLGGLAKYFGKMNEKDAKSDFLYALKPLLHPERRTRVDEAVNILRVMKVMRMMKDGGLLG